MGQHHLRPGIPGSEQGSSNKGYGSAPAVIKRGLAFVEAGEYQCVGAVNCALGRYITKPITITVRKRSPKELAAIKKHEILISSLFNVSTLPERQRWAALMELDGQIELGSNKETLKLFRDVIGYHKIRALSKVRL